MKGQPFNVFPFSKSIDIINKISKIKLNSFLLTLLVFIFQKIQEVIMRVAQIQKDPEQKQKILIHS